MADIISAKQTLDNAFPDTIPESGCEVGCVHKLSPQTRLSTNHKLLLLISACVDDGHKDKQEIRLDGRAQLV